MADLWISWLILSVACTIGVIKLLSAAARNESSYYMRCDFNTKLDKEQSKKGIIKW